MDGDAPRAAISFGVGENDSKRIGGDFEAQVIRALGEKYRTVWVDRGVGGEEARRVTSAAEASGCAGPGSVLGRIVRRFRFGDRAMRFLHWIRFRRTACGSGGGRPLISFFAGAPSRAIPASAGAPRDRGRIQVIDADSLTPAACLKRLFTR